jgi:hypothetical protein
MSGSADRELISGKSSEVSVKAAVRSSAGIPAREWFYQALSRHNLALLGMISGFLAGVDTFQSFYLQRVVNQFNEVNLLPLKFYSHGLIGYLLYVPIDFLTLFATLAVLWIWASYLLWYYKRFVSPRFGSRV